MEGSYFVLAGMIVVALIAFIISYREDHPKKTK